MIVEDPFGELFVSNVDREVIFRRLVSILSPEDRERVERESDPRRALELAVRCSPVYGGVVVRGRYVEDRLRAAVGEGCTQYVLLGAGFDSFALRRPAWARNLLVIEIDQAATQELKAKRLRQAGVESPAGLFQQAADLSRETLSEVLARTPHRRDERTFFSVLGLTPYLSLEANRRLFSAIAVSGGHAEVVFDYIDRLVFDSETSPGPARRLVEERSSSGEPFRSGFRPLTLAADLEAVGLELIEDLDPAAAEARYCSGREDGLHLGAPGHIAFARRGKRGPAA